MTVKEFVGAQSTVENPMKFKIIAPNVNGTGEKLTVENYATFAPMEILMWAATPGGSYINLFVG